MPSRKQHLQQRLADLIGEGRKVHETAEAEERNLTADELKADQDRQAEIDDLQANIEAIRRQEERERGLEAATRQELAPDDPAAIDEGGEAAFGGAFGFGQWLQAVADFYAPTPVSGVERGNAKDPGIFAATPSGGLNETADPEGGIFLSRQRSDLILEKTYSIGQILQRVERFPVSPGFDGHKIPALDETSRADGSRFGGISSAWLDAGEKLSGSKPKFHMLDLGMHRVGVLVYVTNTIVRDAATLQSFIMNRTPLELRFRGEDAIFNGHGAGQPLGFLHASYKGGVEVAKETGQDAKTVLKENIDNMWARMWAPSRENAIWVVDQTIEPQLNSMSLPIGTGGTAVYLPPGGLADSPFGRLMGRPVIPVEYGATLGSVGDISLFDPTQYAMSERAAGLRADSSMHARFEFDEMAFRFIWELDGEPQWHSTLTPKSGGDAQSAFVTLAARA